MKILYVHRKYIKYIFIFKYIWNILKYIFIYKYILKVYMNKYVFKYKFKVHLKYNLNIYLNFRILFLFKLRKFPNFIMRVSSLMKEFISQDYFLEIYLKG